MAYRSLFSTFLFWIATSFSCLAGYEWNLAIAAIFRDEAPYLREWIEFHKLVGVEHFYLFNHFSQDNCREVLEPYIQSGEVELIDWFYNVLPDSSNWSTIQLTSYEHAFALAIGRAKWVAVIDTDEFLFPVEQDSLVDFLQPFEGVAAVTANWQLYGTSGYETVPNDRLMIEVLTYKAPEQDGENRHLKSIVRPEMVAKRCTPHAFEYKAGKVVVDASGDPIDSGQSLSAVVKVDKLRINHYWSRDGRFFHERKIARRGQWGEGPDGCYARLAKLNTVEDRAIYKYVPALRERMGLAPSN